ncbi:hypothetical protein ACSNOB_14730 [Micromonospora sp. URMC 106]|uniref:hypothetical protein n=1 Tax=Micromonospora sp. URMC 106 TaxID=3423408 RepID=UPI003F1E4196
MKKFDRTTWLLIAGSAACTVVAIIFSIAAWAVANSPSSGPDRPKVTDWIQAWGSVGGVIAGLLAATAAGLLFRFEQRRAEKAERQIVEERAEAALNVARAVVVSGASFGGYGVNVDPHLNSVSLSIRNYSSHPIRNVTIVVTLPTGFHHVIQPPYDVIGPGEGHTVDKRYSVGIQAPDDYKFHQEKALVTVCFIDNTNQAWQRTSSGGVERTTVPYPLVEEARDSGGTVWDESSA